MFVITCPITSIVGTEASPQGIGYERALDGGFPPQKGQTPRRITTSHARPITREQPRGSFEARFLKTGCQEVPLHGFMENVCPPSLLSHCSTVDVPRPAQPARVRASSGLSFP